MQQSAATDRSKRRDRNEKTILVDRFVVVCQYGSCTGKWQSNLWYGYYNQQRRQPQTNTGTLFTTGYGYSIEASGLTNLKPDALVVVFVNDEANGPAESSAKVNSRVTDFTKALGALGIARSDIFVDFITQNRVYDYEMQGGQATENFTRFETKKTFETVR